MNWLMYAILGAVLAGTSPVLAKSGMHKANSHLAAALRGTFLFLGAWFMVSQTDAWVNISGIGQTTFLYLVFSGIATGIVWICFIRALQLGEVIKAVPVVEGSVILNLLAGMFLLKDEITWNKIAIIIIMTAGMLMMALKGSGRGGKRGAWIGYAIGAMVFTTVTVILDRVGITGVNETYERMVRYGIALITVWLVVFATKGYRALKSMSFLNGILLCLSGAAMGAAWFCFHKAFVLGTNAVVEMIECFDLVAAVFLGCVFMRERLSVRAIFGMIFMMLGFWLFLADLPIIPL